MKKLLWIGLGAAGLLLATERPAHAWVNFKFSAGINWQYQSGNNCWLWGLFNNGQIPDGYGFGMGVGNLPPDASFAPYYGGTAPSMPAAAGSAYATTPAANFSVIPAWYGGSPYRTTGYAPNFYDAYAAPYGYYGR